MPTELPAMESLRQATRASHADLEQRLQIGAEGAGREDFVRYLQALHGWLGPIEAGLWDGQWPPALDAAARDGKRGWIDADLRNAGMSEADIAGLPQSGYAPTFDTLAERFGVAYVVEGAQLGGQVLRKSLGPALGAWSPRWLQGYGSETAAQWKNFICCAEQSLASESERKSAGLAAEGAFSSLANWLTRQGAARELSSETL